MLRAASTAIDKRADAIQRKRELVADLCRLLGRRLGEESSPTASPAAAPAPLPPLSPRMRQTLDLLLEGASEKQIAGKLSLSQHTVHVYVKALHRGFDVSSRGELLSKFIVSKNGHAGLRKT